MFPLGLWMMFPFKSVNGPLGLICGATYLCPKSPLKPEYPSGSSGRRSGRPLFADAHSAAPAAQWMPIPTKSAKACLGFDTTSFASTEPTPNTVGISIAVFSRIVLAVATAPKLHPALVKGTQGAGAFFPEAVSMLNVVSVGVEVVGSKIGDVQYAKETPRLLVPFGLK